MRRGRRGLGLGIYEMTAETAAETEKWMDPVVVMMMMMVEVMFEPNFGWYLHLMLSEVIPCRGGS
jgi:hypothetical protein